MERQQGEDMEQAVWDAIIGRSYGFSVADGKRFALYPITLGKSVILSRLIKNLDIDEAVLRMNPAIEALRLARSSKETACRIIAICTVANNDREPGERVVSLRSDYFRDNLEESKIAELLLIIFQLDRTDSFISYYGLDKEQKDRDRIARVKGKEDNTVTFGGRSPYGTIIGATCERFGWTVNHIVWGISYTNLRMLIADAVTSIYLSDEEKKKAKIHKGEEVINMDDPKSWERIKSMKWD